MRPKMRALPLVPRQLLRSRGSDRRQHDRHARSLQRLEQHPPPVPRPHDAADLARALLARLPLPASRAPLPWPRRPRRDSVSPTEHRLHHQPRPPRSTRRPALRTRVVVYVRRSIPTERRPTARSDAPGSAPANAGSSSSESPANRGRSGSEPPSPESPPLGFASWGSPVRARHAPQRNPLQTAGFAFPGRQRVPVWPQKGPHPSHTASQWSTSRSALARPRHRRRARPAARHGPSSSARRRRVRLTVEHPARDDGPVATRRSRS